MYIFVEMWNPKQAWLDLSQAERKDYVAAVGAAVKNLTETGVEIITWSLNDKATDRFNGFDYFAIWKFPNMELVKSFQNLVVEAGWYNYFDQVNACGLVDVPQPILEHSIAL